MNGSSPWMLIITSLSSGRKACAASPQRSVPEAWSGEVITATPPKPRTQSAIRSSSVATAKSLTSDDRTRSYTHCTIGLPWIKASGLPGKRVEAYRAGMIP